MAKTKQTREFEANQVGEWKCPHCKELTVCVTIGRTADNHPVIRCAQCDNRFEVGKSGMMEEAKREALPQAD